MRNRRNRHFGTLVALIIFIVLLVFVLRFIFIRDNEKLNRSWKTLTSQYTGGLNRTVSVYSYDGELIKSWTGKFDVDRTEAGVLFDMDGKRVVIQGGIIINEED